MENLKEKYFEAFCKRPCTKEVDLRATINDCSEKLQRSYEGKFKLNNDEDFKKMILIDACFIIELFLRNVSNEQEGMKDYILRKPWLRKAIKLDLILLENQLPFFILQKLFDTVKPSLLPINIPKPKSDQGGTTTTTTCLHLPTKSCGCQIKKFSQQKPAAENYNIDSFLKLACYFFKDHFLTESDRASFDDINEIKNLTDLVREFWRPRELIEDMSNIQGDIGDRKYLYSATKLDKAGVTFKPARKQRSLADVKISNKPFLKFLPGINCMKLKLPELKLENDTECLLRNVMALEQCLHPSEDYICGYVALMDQLINTREDVEFLVEKKILTNLLGSNEEAAKLFNGLCNQIPREKSYYAKLYKELNNFYENRWNVTRATLKKVYFKDLWTGSSTVVGLFVLLFTISATTRNVYLRHL